MNIIIANTINIQVAWLKVDNSKEWVIQMTLIFYPEAYYLSLRILPL